MKDQELADATAYVLGRHLPDGSTFFT